MGAFGKYFRGQFKRQKFSLEHDIISEFYVSCWQRSRATLPLLCVRTILFLGCVALLLSSMGLTGMSLNVGFWFIYMTHWGVFLITITTGFAFAVSCRAYFGGIIDSTFALPWYVKTYWALYNITVPIAFFITAFYWAFLSMAVEEFAIDPVLDVFIHGVNSAVMLVLLLTSRHPTHILHFYMPVLFGLGYLLFSLIYYFAGGVDPLGNRYIYPMLDWSAPGATMIMVVLSAVGILVLHVFVVALTALRDTATKRIRRESTSLTIS